MNPNLKPTDQITLVAVLDPDAYEAATVVTDYVNMANFDRLLAIVQTGTLGADATVDAKLVQAKDGEGTGAKDVAGKAVTQLTKAENDDNQVALSVHADELDTENGFTYVALSVDVGTATSTLSAAVFGLNARYQPAAHIDSLVEIV